MSDTQWLTYSDMVTKIPTCLIKQYNSYFLKFSDNVTRPILIVGPLSEAVLDKLSSDYPDKFARCEPEYMNCDQEALEKVWI